MDVGSALRQARQQAGLSREQVSQETKIQLAKLEALEANDFSRLPDGIYLNGIVRAYARQVGADGDELVRQLQLQGEAGRATVEDLYPAESASAVPPLAWAPPRHPHDVVDTAHDTPRHRDDAPHVGADAPLHGEEAPSPTRTTPLAVSALNRDGAAALDPDDGLLDAAPPLRDTADVRESPDLWLHDTPRVRADDAPLRNAAWREPADQARPAADEDRIYAVPRDQRSVPFHFAADNAAPPQRRQGGWLVPVLVLLGAAGLGAYLYDRTDPFGERAASSVAASSREPEELAALENGTTAEVNPQTDANAAASTAADRSGAAAGNPRAESGTSEQGEDAARTPAAARGGSDIALAGRQNPAPGARTAAAPDPRTSDAPAPGTRTAVDARGTRTGDIPAAAPGTPTSRPGQPSVGATASATPAPSLPSAALARRDEASTERPPDATPARAEAAAHVDGAWTLATRIETTSYQNFEGLELGYRLELQQDGNQVSGRGVKTAENGRPLARSAQTAITVRGTIDGGRLTLTFTEAGTRRTTEGKFILDVQDDGVLRGRFASNAARSSGIVEARRPEG